MFRPLSAHHQAFLRIKSVNAAYLLGFQLCWVDTTQKTASHRP